MRLEQPGVIHIEIGSVGLVFSGSKDAAEKPDRSISNYERHR